jgi:hypothetical protein
MTNVRDDLPQRWIAASPGWCERCLKDWRACVCAGIFGLAIYQQQELRDEVVGQAAQRISLAFSPTSLTSGSLTLTMNYVGLPTLEAIGNPITGDESVAQPSEIGPAATARRFMVQIDHKLNESVEFYWHDPPKDG